MAVIVEESRFTYQDFILRDFGDLFLKENTEKCKGKEALKIRSTI